MATAYALALAISHAAAVALGWYTRHRTQLAALAAAAHDLGPAASEAFREIRKATGPK